MYDDIGKKIKIMSKVLGILSAIGWFIIAIMNDWGVLLGIVLAVVIFLYSWFGYGFGQLVDDIHLIAEEKRGKERVMPETSRPYVQEQTEPYSDNVAVYLLSVGSVCELFRGSSSGDQPHGGGLYDHRPAVRNKRKHQHRTRQTHSESARGVRRRC